MPTGKQCINLYTAFQNLTDKASFEQDVGVLLKVASINRAVESIDQLTLESWGGGKGIKLTPPPPPQFFWLKSFGP